ncbi:MAG: hypothetical protein ACJAV6_000074 [Candidatus Paceibacteria bacterium]|jgi:hypothetical protein
MTLALSVTPVFLIGISTIFVVLVLLFNSMAHSNKIDPQAELEIRKKLTEWLEQNPEPQTYRRASRR